MSPLPAEAVELPESEASYLRRVRRLSPGDGIEIFDGRGKTVSGVIEIPEKKAGKNLQKIIFRPAGPAETHPRPAPGLHLAAAAPKGARLDWLLEKIQELGVTSFQPLVTERAVRVPKKTADSPRIKSRLVEAARQSRQNYLVETFDPVAWADFLNVAESYPAKFIFSPAGRTFGGPPSSGADEDKILLAVGPEGGFTDSEMEEAGRAGFQAVSLGGGVLRVETAAIAAISAARILFSR